jgi:hypothetical protein
MHLLIVTAFFWVFRTEIVQSCIKLLCVHDKAKNNFYSILPLSSVFEKIRTYFGAQSESIPMSFVLGFYVSLIVKRWWEQYKLLPWPDTLALFISAAIPGNVSLFPLYPLPLSI